MSDDEESDIDLMESKDKLFYKEVLHDDTKLRNNFDKVYNCSKSAQVNWKVAEELDWFLFYIFHRRFGWPDLEEENGQLKVVVPDSQIRFRKSGKNEELKYKSQLVDMLDSILLWLNHQLISAMSVLMYSSAIRLASKSPVTRLQLSIRGYDWLKDNLTKDINDKLWHALQEFLILGITDFWSRIRDAAIQRLGPIIERMELSQILGLFDELIRMCNSHVSQWQVIDGAISAICAILKRFQKVGYKSEFLNMHPQIKISSHFHYQIKVGETELDRMPPNIISRLQFLVFKLIYHPQQTIRDNAIKAFVLCLDRYYENDVDAAFQNVCQKLSSRNNGSVNNTNLKTKDPTVVNGHQSYVNPYGAQSLIYLCHHLFKRLHDKINYLENWHHYHSYFDQYLSHPASSVRLVSSNLYTYAVSQAISHPLLVTNIIHNLIAKWNPDQTVLLQTVNSLSQTVEYKTKKRISITKLDFDKDESSSWEWREGRLLVFELLAKLIIKNHLWYTFGTTEVESVYSSDITNSKRNDADSDRSFLNLCNSTNGLPQNDPSPDVNEDCLLSASLDGRRFTLANLPTQSLKFKAMSDTSIPVIIETNEDPKRRKSHDIGFRKISEDNFSSSTISVNNLTISKSHVATSTKNLHIMNHSSFLIHVKEIECNDAVNMSHKNKSPNPIESKLPTFRSLLSQMLHTSAESLIDSQWELRRMAKQALPPLGEVLRWFDPELLVDIIHTHLKFEPTLMTSICLQLLHDSLLHTSRLKQLRNNAPLSWQLNVAHRVVDNIVTCVENNLPLWMKSCQHYLDRSTLFDCITPHTMNIVITCISNYYHIIPVSALSKGLIDAFMRLDTAIKIHGTNFIIIHNFELHPNPSNILSSDCPALDYAVQLIDFLKQGLISWWQKLSTPMAIRTHYDQHKESIISCGKLVSVLASWIYPVSEMRGDNARYIRDMHKLIVCLLKLLIEVMRIDHSTKAIFVRDFIQLLDVLATYVQYKNIKLDVWWMRQLMEVVFMWMEEFTALEINGLCSTDLDEKKSIFSITLQALLQRFHSSNNHRRATIGAATPSMPINRPKRYSITDIKDPINRSTINFVQSKNESNLELFSSQATNENVEYVSDESLNDSEGDKKAGFYQESHVLSIPTATIQGHLSTSPLDLGTKKHCSLSASKSHSPFLFEENGLNRYDLGRSASSLNTDSADERDASDWDSSTESDEDLGALSDHKNAETLSSEANLIAEIIVKFIKYNPELYEESKSLLSDIDVTILHGLQL